MRVIISVSIDVGLLENIDSQRGDIPRSKFIMKILESGIKTNSDSKLKSKNIIPADNSFRGLRSTGMCC